MKNQNEYSGNMSGEMSGIQHAVDTIKESGLSSVDEMRTVVEEEDFRRWQADMQTKLSEYKNLFDRWTVGGKLTDADLHRMGTLSAEFQKINERMRVSR